LTESRPPAGGSRSRGLWVLIIVLLTPAIVLPLIVPLYDKVDPKLVGFPFYFWFQFALILMSAALTVTAFALSRTADRRDREAGR
jgi:hypothetical protein